MISICGMLYTKLHSSKFAEARSDAQKFSNVLENLAENLKNQKFWLKRHQIPKSISITKTDLPITGNLIFIEPESTYLKRPVTYVITYKLMAHHQLLQRIKTAEDYIPTEILVIAFKDDYFF